MMMRSRSEVGKIHDISPLICERTAVFPGDQAFQRKVLLDFESGGNLLLSSILSTVHIGAHADAPNHYHADGVGIDQRDPARYIGPCQVICVSLPRGERIRPEHLEGREIIARRVLFRTGSFPDPMNWSGDFNSLSPDVIEWLADRGVTLVGIDTPSVDPSDSKSLESHQAIYQRDLAILEGIVLEKVPEGVYTLVALPLRIEKADASPVRAILIEEDKNEI